MQTIQPFFSLAASNGLQDLGSALMTAGAVTLCASLVLWIIAKTMLSGKQPLSSDGEATTLASRIKSACQRDLMYSRFKKGVIFFVAWDILWVVAVFFVKNETIWLTFAYVIFTGIAVCGIGLAARGSMLAKQVKSNEPRT